MTKKIDKESLRKLAFLRESGEPTLGEVLEYVRNRENQSYRLDHISEKDIASHADVDGKVKDNGQ